MLGTFSFTHRNSHLVKHPASYPIQSTRQLITPRTYCHSHPLIQQVIQYRPPTESIPTTGPLIQPISPTDTLSATLPPENSVTVTPSHPSNHSLTQPATHPLIQAVHSQRSHLATQWPGDDRPPAMGWATPYCLVAPTVLFGRLLEVNWFYVIAWDWQTGFGPPWWEAAMSYGTATSKPYLVTPGSHWSV
jgi:hypothetical protein